jgi:hypothetical protein
MEAGTLIGPPTDYQAAPLAANELAAITERAISGPFGLGRPADAVPVSRPLAVPYVLCC